jgi:hypothetical protein
MIMLAQINDYFGHLFWPFIWAKINGNSVLFRSFIWAKINDYLGHLFEPK